MSALEMPVLEVVAKHAGSQERPAVRPVGPWRLFCINAENGETAWLDATAHGRSFAAMLDVGPCLAALPSTSELIAFEPSAEGYKELAKIKVAETETYAHPVIAGDSIFVKDQNSLTLWTLP